MSRFVVTERDWLRVPFLISNIAINNDSIAGRRWRNNYRWAQVVRMSRANHWWLLVVNAAFIAALDGAVTYLMATAFMANWPTLALLAAALLVNVTVIPNIIKLANVLRGKTYRG